MIRAKHYLDFYSKTILDLFTSEDLEVNGIRTVKSLAKENIQNISEFDLNKVYAPFSIVQKNGILYFNIKESHNIDVSNPYFWKTNHVENSGENAASGISSFGAVAHLIFRTGTLEILKSSDKFTVSDGDTVGKYIISFKDGYTPFDTNYNVSVSRSVTWSNRMKTYEDFIDLKDENGFTLNILNVEDDVDNVTNTVEDDIIVGLIIFGKKE